MEVELRRKFQLSYYYISIKHLTMSPALRYGLYIISIRPEELYTKMNSDEPHPLIYSLAVTKRDTLS